MASVIPWGLGHTLSLLVGSWSLFQTGLSMSILVEFVTDDMTLNSITPGCSLSNSNSMQVEKGMHQADHHHGPLAHMLCLVYQEEHLRTQWLTAHSKNMDLAGCPEVKGSPLLGAVGEGHLLEISLLYCAQHVATIMPAILPCPCTGRKNTKRLLSQVTGQVVSQVTGQVVLQVTGQVVLQVTGQVVLQVTGQVVLQVTSQVVSQVTGQVVSQVTGQVVLQVTGQVVLQVTGQVVLQVTGQVVLQVTGQVVNVTHSPLTPFKIISKTNLTQFSHSPVEVHRSQGDIQWLYEVLLDTAPHKGGASSQASHLIGRHCDYLVSLEHHLLGLALHMEQSTRLKSSTEKTVHWFCALSESEPANTYLKVAMGNLAQTYESVEGHQIDTDDTLFIQSLQIIKASHNTPMGSPKTGCT
ncbi:hypothetical protein EMCRGX_G020543 [Ephydatia muelleri]